MKNSEISQPLIVFAYAAGGSVSMPYIGDHTYALTVKKTISEPDIYFDSGGGNIGDNTKTVLQSGGSNANLVAMTIGEPYPKVPYKSEYGKNDVTGKETCGVVMSGFRSRLGTCQQCVNRLLYAVSPDKSNPITMLQGGYVPRGYLLTTGIFGIWGRNFNSWCDQAGFPTPPNELEFLEQSLDFLASNKKEMVLNRLLDLRNMHDSYPFQEIDSESFEKSLEKDLDSKECIKLGLY